MDIKTLYEGTDLTLQAIADQLGVPVSVIYRVVNTNYTVEQRRERKRVCYRNSKRGELNPMRGKAREQHHNYKGRVADGKGYFMILKPEWYTGRRGSKHVFEHSVVVCAGLGITEVPKGWCVHHCNEVKTDNRFENLVLLTTGDHRRLHTSLEASTTISKESTLKWVEAHGTPWRDDMV